MEDQDFISIQQFCSHYKIPVTFIEALEDYEVIEIVRTKNVKYLDKSKINEVEKMIRLHYDLDINLEGIDAIYNLLKQVEVLQNKIMELNNKLRFYEDM